MKHAVSAVSILLLLVSMISFLGYLQVPNVLAVGLNPIVLPFATGFESSPTIDPHGRTVPYTTTSIDWKTDNFYGYSGSGSPSLEIEDASVNPPDGYNLLDGQLAAKGYFGGNYSYCYFNLFDQESASDFNTPIKLQKQTYINVWYCHVGVPCAMIDAQLYNRATGQWLTLRDFNDGNGHYIVDQNYVRIHPADRRYDAVNEWKFSCFDLSMIYQNDPDQWYITKIWVGMDNNPSQGPVKTGSAVTYFDNLHITYGAGKTNSASLPGYGFGCTAQVTASIVADTWSNGPVGSGTHILYLKCSIFSNSFGEQWFDNPTYSYLNVTGPLGGSAQPFRYGDGHTCIDSANLSNTDPTNPHNPDWLSFGADVGFLIAGTLLGGPEITGGAITALMCAEVITMIGQLIASAYQTNTNHYTYIWPISLNMSSGPFGGDSSLWPSGTYAGVYIGVTVPDGSGSFSLPIDMKAAFWYKYWDDYYRFVHDGDVSVHIDFPVNTYPSNPSSGAPSIGVSQPSFADMILKHIGDPNGNDCDMQVTVNGQWPGEYLYVGQTVPIRYWGKIWARPGARGNAMVAVLGIEGTPLDTTAVMQPGIYPGINFDKTFSFTASFGSGTYRLYGIAAAVIDPDTARQQYIDYPSMRFLVGTVVIGNSNPIIFVHGPTFTVTASVYPPQCYLLNSQTVNGQTYYASSWIADGSGNQVGNTNGMVCSQCATQSLDTGGVFTCNLDLSGLPINAYYYVRVHADGTNGQDFTSSKCIYYYNNIPYMPSPPTGSMSGSAYTYALSTLSADPDGDNVYYQFDWDDNSPYTTVGPYASGTKITRQHTFGSMTTYDVRVRAGITLVGPWSEWAINPIEVHNPKLTISVVGQGSTNSSTQSYTYGTRVTVKATPSTGYYFAYWFIDGSRTNYSNPITMIMDNDHSITAHFYINTGGCPILYTYDGANYQCEGLLNIHDIDGVDVTTNHVLTYTPGQVDRLYYFELIEHPQTISHIDQVKLFAVIEDGKTISCPLMYAWHSELGNVRQQLMFDDESKVIELGADHNSGTSQSIQLGFLAIQPKTRITAFLFQIEGCNWIVKV